MTEEERQARVAELDLDMANIYKVSCHSWYDLTDQQKSELADLYSDILPPPTLTLRGGGFLGCTS